jgi:hypothetical protein
VGIDSRNMKTKTIMFLIAGLFLIGFVNAACVDSDGGRNYNILGEVSLDSEISYEDTCHLGKLKEYYCEGDQVAEEIVDCFCASSPGLDGVCIEETTCDDSENQANITRWYQNPFEKGIINIVYMNRAGFEKVEEVVDECNDEGFLIDYSCSPSGEGEAVVGTGFGDYIECENGCVDGACLEVVEENGTICKDSDGGKNYYKKGFVSGLFKDSVNVDSLGQVEELADVCILNGSLAGSCKKGEDCKVVEYFCDGGELDAAEFKCENGCVDGACVKQNEGIKERITCFFEDTEKGQKCYLGKGEGKHEGTSCSGIGSCEIDIRGFKGEDLVWKSSCGGYAYTTVDGEDEEIKFNCRGGEIEYNRTKKLGFYDAFWECYDGTFGAAETSSCRSLKSLKREARKFCKDLCYEDGSKCGVNSFSVWEECYEDEFAEEEEFEDEEQEPVEEESALVCKDSCPLNDKCYPFGYRKGGRFCSDGGQFIGQADKEGTCENNFECASNVCVDSECISAGLMRRILNWFKGIFS